MNSSNDKLYTVEFVAEPTINGSRPIITEVHKKFSTKQEVSAHTLRSFAKQHGYIYQRYGKTHKYGLTNYYIELLDWHSRLILKAKMNCNRFCASII